MEIAINSSVAMYYSLLQHLGYKKYNDVYKLIVLISIQEILKLISESYPKDEDISIIYNTLNCLSNSDCIIGNLSNINIEEILNSGFTYTFNFKLS